jgi:hypothetical protein
MTMQLPDGWERTDGVFAWIVYLTWRRDDGPVSVTIDEKKRGYAVGYGAYVRPMSGYTGRGWKEALYADAIKALRKPWEDPPTCHAARDGECFWHLCPQLRDNEPGKSGRHCPLDMGDDE